MGEPRSTSLETPCTWFELYSPLNTHKHASVTPKPMRWCVFIIGRFGGKTGLFREMMERCHQSSWQGGRRLCVRECVCAFIMCWESLSKSLHMISQFKYPDHQSSVILSSVISLELRPLAQSLMIHRGTSRAFPTVVQHETPRGSWIWRNVRKTGSWRCWAAGGIDPSDPDLCGPFSYVWTPVKTPQNTQGSGYYVHICLSSYLHICHSAHIRALSLCCYSLNNWGQRASPLDAGKPGPCVSERRQPSGGLRKN